MNQKLYAFGLETLSPACSIYYLTKSFALIVNHSHRLAGWILRQPLENVTLTLQGERDPEIADSETYRIFEKYFQLFSDNQCDEHDIVTVTKNLVAEVTPPRALKIKGEVRRTAFEEGIAALKASHLDER